MMTKPAPAPKVDRREVRVRPNTYRPTKAELEEDVSIHDASPEDVIRAAFRPATVVEDPDA